MQPENEYFDILGSHKFWLSKLDYKRKIIHAYQSRRVYFWIGWKIPGTQVPWVITAGTYIKRKAQFWDVCNKKKYCRTQRFLLS
jgi:hypothetical protein